MRAAFLVATLLLAGAAAFALVGKAAGTLGDQASVDGNTFTTDTLDPPTGLAASVVGSDIQLNWTATVDTYASGYKIYRSLTLGGPYSEIDTLIPATATTYTDNTVTAGVRYFYVLRTYFQNWLSVDSNEANEAVPATSSFVSAADSDVDEQNPNNNNGTGNVMTVRSWQTGNNQRSFVQFNVSSIPAGSTINSATLTLCATTVPTATRTYDVRRVNASWVETTLTWNNQPAVAATATDSATTPASAQCMTWTVTADVQAWVDGTANNGWRASDSVESQGTNYWSEFRTRENSVTGERPKLDVTYTPP